MSYFISSVDNWLDEKKKRDGAEGLWRIHNKLYDFTVWARSHPGGRFWIETTRGLDITEAFESHHFSTKAKSLLKNFYMREAASPRNSDVTFSETGFYKRFKQKAFQTNPAMNAAPSLKAKLRSDSLVVAVFLTGLLGIKRGMLWTAASGILLGVLAISSHAFLHLRDNWRLHYFNLTLMSSREWKIRHVLSHHQCRGTVWDLEIPTRRQFSKSPEGLTKYLLNFLAFPIAAHAQFMKRCLDVFLSKKLLFYWEELITFSFPLFLFLFGGERLWETFVTWNHIVLMGSFFYCFFCFTLDKSHSQTDRRPYPQGRDRDFGVVQLILTEGHPKENESVFSFLNMFRNNVLHYLCPALECGSLSKLLPAFDEICEQHGIQLPEKYT